MAEYDGSIRIDTKIDSSGFNKGVASISQGFAGITKAAGAVGIALTAAFAVKQIIAFGKQAVALASDLQEVQNVVDTAFGSMAYKMEEFADKSIEMYGISKLSAKQTGSTFMAMARGMKISSDSASDMAIQLTALSADMSSFYNVSQDVASTALKSVFTGETETLKQFGIVMTQANLQQFAYENGIKANISSMSQAEQVQLRYMYVMKQTSMVQGDFARTSDSWANQTRMLSENWKEFLSILGSGLIQVLLPLVQILNELLKGLIKIAKAIGYVIKVITGKGASSTKDIAGATENLGSSADIAADGENNLASGIGSAAKAAQNALAKFDQLDVLQQNLGSGGSGGDSGIDIGDFDIGDFGIDTEDSLDDAKKKIDSFLVGLHDKLEEFATEPVLAFEPIFAPIPDPVYEPNWNLNPNPVPVPIFAPIPGLIYNPNWGLNPNPVPAPVFVPLPNPIYDPDWGLNSALVKELGLVFGEIDEFETDMGLTCAEVQTVFDGMVNDIINGFTMTSPSMNEFEINFGISSEGVQTSLSDMATAFVEQFKKSLDEAKAFETDFGISAESVQKAFKGEEEAIKLGTNNMCANFKELKETAVKNTGEFVLATASSFENWKASTTTAVYQTADYMIKNFNNALETAAGNVSAYVKNTSENFVTWGNSMLNTAWETAKGLASNFVSGLKNAWDNFKSFIEATGESLTCFWNENKSWIKPTLVVTGLVAAGAALVLSGGSLAAPLAAGASAVIPALATGAVIPPNQQFMAILGDQKSGRNLEAPESLIRQIMKEELAGLGEGGDMTIDMPVYLDGEVIYRNQKKVERRHGKKLVTGGI